MSYDNTNSGALFTNAKKQTEKHPDFTGTINIDGKEVRLAGWRRTAKSSGQKFISLKVDNYQSANDNPGGAYPQPQQRQASGGGGFGGDGFGSGADDDEIPF